MNSGNISKKGLKKGFEKIKSDYFLRKLFNIIKINKSLVIMKYNKKLQKRLNISINDYKECSKIEIELKLADNKYGQFINISGKENYCHIYFDNSNKEIKRNYLEENEEVKMIKIIIDYQFKSLEKLFHICNSIDSIYFKKFYRNNITNMSYMFSGCSSLKELNLSNFNTNKVNNMSYMFTGCSSLKELNLSNCITNKVTNMSGMFNKCSSLKELNLSNFNTNNVTNMRDMLDGCSSLKELNISNFNNKNVINMCYMFSECSLLKQLNISNFITDNVTDMSGLFFLLPFIN